MGVNTGVRAEEKTVRVYLVAGVGISVPECLEEYWTLSEAEQDVLANWLEDDGKEPQGYTVVNGQGELVVTMMRDYLYPNICHAMDIEGNARHFWVNYTFDGNNKYSGPAIHELCRDEAEHEWMGKDGVRLEQLKAEAEVFARYLEAREEAAYLEFYEAVQEAN